MSASDARRVNSFGQTAVCVLNCSFSAGFWIFPDFSGFSRIFRNFPDFPLIFWFHFGVFGFVVVFLRPGGAEETTTKPKTKMKPKSPGKIPESPGKSWVAVDLAWV